MDSVVMDSVMVDSITMPLLATLYCLLVEKNNDFAE